MNAQIERAQQRVDYWTRTRATTPHDGGDRDAWVNARLKQAERYLAHLLNTYNL